MVPQKRLCTHETDGYSEWDIIQEDLWRCSKCGEFRKPPKIRYGTRI